MEQNNNSAATKLATKHYLQEIKRDWKNSVPAFLLPAIGSVLVFYIPPLIVARILSRFSNTQITDLGVLVPYLTAFILLWSLGEIFWRLGIFFLIRTEINGAQHLYKRAIDYLLKKDLSFFHNNFAGSLTKRVTGYCWKYVDLLDTLVFNFFSAYLPILFVIVVLWHFSPWLVLGLLGLMAMVTALVIPLIVRRQKLVAVRETARTKTTGYIADILSNIDTVKAFASEEYEEKIYSQHVADFMKKSKKSWDYQNFKIDTTISPFFVMTNAVGLVVALLVSRHSNLNLEVVFVTFNYFAIATRTMWEFNHVYRNLESAITEGAQFTELILDDPKVTDINNPKRFNVSRGEIEFKQVDFRYQDENSDQLFQNFNLKIKPGEKVALVGRSGGGKTTITKLLLRFMDIESGEILIDGQNIANVRQNDLRQKVAYVPQEPAMFHRSLSENIRYGNLSASDEDVKKAAKQAHATEFIAQLPSGYDTLVGERGIKLSGGQRQRIAIARAMIKNAPILILDEATSALDSESEKYIQDALWKLMEDRTVIVVAHRLSTIAKMDRIVVLENGKIAEEGTHQELLTKKGIYAGLWDHQSGGFLE